MFLFSFFGLSQEVFLLFLMVCLAAYFFLRQRTLKKSLPEDWPRWKTAAQFQDSKNK